MDERAVIESPVAQGKDEEISYKLTTSPWGTAPTAITVVVYDITDEPWVNVTSTVMPTNSPSVTGDVITLSPLKLLTPAHNYRIEIKFTSGVNKFETYCLVFCWE